MARYDLNTLRSARDQAKTLADSGIGVAEARAELRKRGLSDDLADLGIRLVSAENQQTARNKRRGRLTFGGVLVVASLIGFAAMGNAHPDAAKQISGVLLGVLGTGAGLILFTLLAGVTQKGWQAAPDPTKELGIRLSDLQGDTEVLRDAAQLHKRRRRVEIISWVVGIPAAFFLVFIFWPKGAEPGLVWLGVTGFVAIFFSVFIKMFLLGSEGLSNPVGRTIYERAPEAAGAGTSDAKTAAPTSQAPPTSRVPPTGKAAPPAGPAAGEKPPPIVRDSSVPKLPSMQVPPDADVARAPMLRPGALSINVKEGEDKKHAGLLVFTTLGIVYLPDLDNMFIETAKLLGPQVVSYTAPQGISQLLSFAEDLAGTPRTATGWFVKALGDRRHFVIPWPELVRVRLDVGKQEWTLTRQLPDGNGRNVTVESVTDDDLTHLLFGARLRFEIDATVYNRLVGPQQGIVEAEERSKAAIYYGDDVATHEAEIQGRIAELLGRWLESRKADADEVVRQELKQVLIAYASVPGLAGQHPELFGAGRR